MQLFQSVNETVEVQYRGLSCVPAECRHRKPLPARCSEFSDLFDFHTELMNGAIVGATRPTAAVSNVVDRLEFSTFPVHISA